MAEWLIEAGIGETRAIRVANGSVVAARLDLPGGLKAGEVLDAVLIARATGSRRGTVRAPSGEEALVDQLPPSASEGAPLRVRITRPSIGEAGRLKRAQCRPTTAAPGPADPLPGQLVRAFPPGLWEDVHALAATARLDFPGGAIALFPTPAMTLIDIDGTLPPRALALAAIPAIAQALRQLDIAGNIGIDFPTLHEKADRRAVDDALAAALDDWPHERTGINGFGFVQLVARLERPSLLSLVARDRPSAAARQLLRQAERVAEPGALLLTCHPAVHAAVSTEHADELARRTGRVIRWTENATLALDGGFAQAVPS
ncbi:MAG: ribonuclease [Sphingomonadales bacterium]|nr:ribonuclease [Sphingomonadales bacterium]